MTTHKDKLSFFHSHSRSQASLLDSQDPHSYRPSPLDSPLSPDFPSHSIPPSSERDERRHEAANSQRFEHNSANAPDRSLSQRSPPGQQGSSALQGQNSASVRLLADNGNPRPHRASQPAPAKAEPKKKGWFFRSSGGATSSSKEPQPVAIATSSRSSLGRSVSVRQPIESTKLTKAVPRQTLQQQRSPSVISTSGHSFTAKQQSEYGEPSPSSPLSPQSPRPVPPPKGSQHPFSPGEDRPYIVQPPQTAITASTHTQAGVRPSNYSQSSSTEQVSRYSPFPPATHPTNNSALSQATASRSTQELAHPPTAQSRDSRPASRQSTLDPPSPSFPPQSQHQRAPSYQTTASSAEKSRKEDMAPAHPQQSSHGRSIDSGRSVDSNQQQSSNREGNSHTSHGQGQGNQQPGQVYGQQLTASNAQNGNYRGTPQPSPVAQQSAEHGRNTPPPARSRDDLSSSDYDALAKRYDELNEKYRKVKKYYFDKDSQVQTLQNTLAHQRLAQSRTSLDDNEYASRFDRLNGAIHNLAFNIRKEWRAVPYWLAPHVNREALTTTTKEMTAVGRACITRWIVDELLGTFFHPSLEPSLSVHLKIIERNLRKFAAPTPTDEERDALLAKISNWRLSTLDGLQDALATQEAVNYRADLTDDLIAKLTSSLTTNLKEPPPVGLEQGVTSIIEIAVGIAANLPLESRDVYVDYVLPGTLVDESYMKIEGTLPALTNPGLDRSVSAAPADYDNGDGDDSSDSGDEKENEGKEREQQQQQQQQGTKKKGFFKGTSSGKKGGPSQPTPPGSSAGKKGDEGPKEERVRFAAFMAVEVRHRTTLVKAPVFI